MLAKFRRKWMFVSLVACGCQTWSRVPLAPGIARELPARSYVVRLGGERVALARARATADSIVGTRQGGRYTISRDDVAFVEERHLSTGRTIGAAAALWMVWVLVSMMIHINDSEPYSCPNCDLVFY
jgi:hypothetical protein